MDQGSFRGKTVWITGASGGLGEALVHGFRAVGARLVLSARREDALARLAGDLGGGPDEVMIAPMDLARPDAIDEAVRTVHGRLGAVDVLVNNAGQTQRGLVRDTVPAVTRTLFEVNVFGPLALTRAVLPAMTAAGGGRIVVISSIAALYASPYRSGYGAAKKALHGLFNALRAEEHGNGIRVCLVVLGAVRTDVSINALRADGGRYGRMDPVIEAGMDPAAAARRIVRAAARGREEVLVAPLAQRWLVWREKYFPGLAARAVRLEPTRRDDRPRGA